MSSSTERPSSAPHLLTYLHTYVLTYLHQRELLDREAQLGASLTYILTYLHTYLLTYLHQRELLDREAQLGAAHQASLGWVEERSQLVAELAAANTSAAHSRAQAADAALAAAAEAERDGRALLRERDEEVRDLRRRLQTEEVARQAAVRERYVSK